MSKTYVSDGRDMQGFAMFGLYMNPGTLYRRRENSTSWYHMSSHAHNRRSLLHQDRKENQAQA